MSISMEIKTLVRKFKLNSAFDEDIRSAAYESEAAEDDSPSFVISMASTAQKEANQGQDDERFLRSVPRRERLRRSPHCGG